MAPFVLPIEGAELYGILASLTASAAYTAVCLFVFDTALAHAHSRKTATAVGTAVLGLSMHAFKTASQPAEKASCMSGSTAHQVVGMY